MASEESFRVTDRRRGGGEPPGDRELPSSGGTGPPPPPSPQDVHPPRPPSPPAGAPEGGPGLGDLFVMFASSALIHLGEAEDPVSGEHRVDLEQAREAIDVLLLLREKTRGNLTVEESRMLEDVLYDLQLRFVRATGRR